MFRATKFAMDINALRANEVFLLLPLHCFTGLLKTKQVSEKILRFLIYFDLFSYPLTKAELSAFIGAGTDKANLLDEALQLLVESGIIFLHDGFYHINPDKSIIERRIKGNQLALKRMKTALRFSKIIARFPYVRGVLLSGSISKGFMAENDDIDYFIITSPGRIWLTRTLLTLFKKIFLFNSYRNFCINYFLDDKHLALQERDLYAASEIVFLIPTYNPALYYELLRLNNWVKNFYPTFQQTNAHEVSPVTFLKPVFEYLLDNRFGKWIEHKLYQKSKKIINRKYKHMSMVAFEQSFTLETHEIRYFPIHSKLNIRQRYQEQLKLFSTGNYDHMEEGHHVTRA